MLHQNSDVPPLKELTIENITNTSMQLTRSVRILRVRFLFERLVAHLHDFARETRLSTAEWEIVILFLTDCGKICSDIRQELILLPDVLGLSLLVDSIDHPKPPIFTEGTVLGPFRAHVSETVTSGAAISHDPSGEPLLVVCTVKNSKGRPVVEVEIDVSETDSKRFYDVQYADREGFDGRAVLSSDEYGAFHFRAIVPVPYPILDDGPVGKLLKVLKRHQYRPSHMDFMFRKPGYDPLITALYLRGDPYETSDAVFGVKKSLVVDLQAAADVHGCRETFGVPRTMKVLECDFVRVTDAEVTALRNQKTLDAASALGLSVKLENGLLVRGA